MTLGDYVVAGTVTLNACAMLAYAAPGHWLKAWYWAAALQINVSILLISRAAGAMTK